VAPRSGELLLLHFVFNRDFRSGTPPRPWAKEEGRRLDNPLATASVWVFVVLRSPSAAHHVWVAYAESATPSTLDNNQRGTGATQGTPEGTYTDEDKEGSAKARTKRLEDIHHWRGCKHQHARCQATREQSKSARKGDEGGAGIGGHTAAFGCGG
jgi:hypothetical protein